MANPPMKQINTHGTPSQAKVTKYSGISKLNRNQNAAHQATKTSNKSVNHSGKISLRKCTMALSHSQKKVRQNDYALVEWLNASFNGLNQRIVT